MIIFPISQTDSNLAGQVQQVVATFTTAKTWDGNKQYTRPELAKTPRKEPTLTAAMRNYFLRGHGIIIIGSCAIAFRTLGGLCQSKTADPPVICVDSDRQAVIVLLAGKHGGEQLATQLAEQLQCPVVGCGVKPRIGVNEPSGDGNRNIQLGLMADYQAEPLLTPLEQAAGWRWHRCKDAAKLIQATKAQQIKVETIADFPCQALPQAIADSKAINSGAIAMKVSWRVTPDTVDYHLCPKVFTLGIGCIRNANSDQLIAWVKQQLDKLQIASSAIAAIASLEQKADEYALHQLASALRCQLRFFTAAELNQYRDKITAPSRYVLHQMGTASVAEAAALALVDSADLFLAKQKCKQATLAIAKTHRPIPTAQLKGQQCGILAVVGIGPGGNKFITSQALACLDQADMIFGLQQYTDRCNGLSLAEIKSYQIGEERLRVKQAIAFAARGKYGVLVCSGDPAIYALASLVYQEVAVATDPFARAIRIQVEPGISALQLASARYGAIINHDFCAISLSNLLTPEAIIMQRVRAAAESDFVIALYNPQSQQRRKLLAAAIAVIQQYRPSACPVIIARRLGQQQETSSVTTITNIPIADIDMHTIIICGNSESKAEQLTQGLNGQCVYTPRGYRHLPNDLRESRAAQAWPSLERQ